MTPGKRRVLIVDDELDIREIVCEFMALLNIDYDTAENGRVALDHLRTKSYDAVLCDIMMPEMNGIECLANAIKENISTPFIFISGWAGPEHFEQARKLGALEFVTKPFSRNDIKRALSRFMAIE